MNYSTIDKEFVFMGKECFPRNLKSSDEFSNQVKILSSKYGLKYRFETIDEGIGGWVPRIIEPVIYRKVLRDPIIDADISDYSIDDIVYFKNDHFMIKYGYDALKRDLMDLYDTFSMVNEAEKEISENRKRIGKYEREETGKLQSDSYLKEEEIKNIIQRHLPEFLKCAEDGRYTGDKGQTYWSYKYATEIGDDRHYIYQRLKDVVSAISIDIGNEFKRTVDGNKISREFHKKWEAEGIRIIIPKRFRQK